MIIISDVYIYKIQINLFLNKIRLIQILSGKKSWKFLFETYIKNGA